MRTALAHLGSALARWGFAVAGVLFLVLAGVTWRMWPRAAPNANVSPARPIRLLVSGDTAGWIMPCGCTSNQSGGLLRRGAFLKEQCEGADVGLLDAGGAPGGTAPYQRLKFEAILKGEKEMGS